MYGIKLSDHGYGALELADLVVNLPPGCALWRAAGGPLAWSDEVHMLAKVEHGLRVLAWQKTEDGSKGRNPPKPIEPPALAGEVREVEAARDAKARAWEARQARMKDRSG